MKDEQINVSAETSTAMDANSYVEALNQLKASTVDKSLLDAAREENKRLLNALATQRPVEPTQVEDNGPTKEELAKIIITPGKSNLEVITASLKHREMVLAETGKDEYAMGTSAGGKYNPTQMQLAQAEATAEALSDLVNEANGDADIFDTLLMRNSYK